MSSTGSIIGGRYRIVSQLGQGAQGEVFEAEDLYQSQTVALKLLTSVGLVGPWHEATVLTRLRDEHILPVLNADLVSGVPFLATELAQHGTLGSATPTDAGVAPADAVKWTRHLCRGATRTHDAGLLHRDIKPDNAFLDEHGRARLGDFGLALLKSPTGATRPGGTLTTMAPEVVAGNECTVASDVYSLGATGYFLLSGRFPHDPRGMDRPQYVNFVNSTEPHRLRDVAPHVSQALASRIERSIARLPQDRYQTPSEFDAALGGLPRVEWSWLRTNEHAAHAGCWRGAAAGRSEMLICAIPATGTTSRFDVVGVTLPSGRRVTRCCQSSVPQRSLARAVRTAIRAT